MNFFDTRPRGTDKFGSGHFGASRGGRTHTGTDYCVQVVAPTNGKVTKIGYPYAEDLSFRYVQITDSNGYDVRVFYVEPIVGVNQIVSQGEPIGSLQTLQKRYPGIQDHIHVEVKTPKGEYISWQEYLHGDSYE